MKRLMILLLLAVSLVGSAVRPGFAAAPACGAKFVADPTLDGRDYHELCRLENVQWDHTFRIRWERASLGEGRMQIFAPDGKLLLTADCQVSPAGASCATQGGTARTWHYDGGIRSIFHVSGDYPMGSTVVLSARSWNSTGIGAGEFEIAGY